MHNAPDTILTVTSRGTITFVNKPLAGYSADVVVNTSILDYLPETEHSGVLHCLSQAFKYGKRSMCDVTGLEGDPYRWYNLSFGIPHAERFAEGLGSTTTLVIREISETKRREDALRASGEQLRDFAARVEAVREEERGRVAREIHDELGQSLTALKLDLAWVQKKANRNTEIHRKMKSMISHIDGTIEMVRKISSELRPSILDDLGLVAAIEWLLAQFRTRSRIRTEFTTNGQDVSPPPEVSAAVFRIVQEALTNVMRHANASKVTVNLARLPNLLQVSIRDNGKGMSSDARTQLKSLGIVGMEERVMRLGGQFKLFSEPGKGTRIEIIIPLRDD